MNKAIGKRIFAWLLAVAMIFTSLNLPSGLMVVKAATSNDCGKSGSSVTWKYNSGTLTFTGKGEMNDYNNYDNKSPWSTYKDSVTKVVVGEGITSTGAFMCVEFSKLTSVSLPSTLEKVGYASFAECSKLATITLPDSLKTIEDQVFRTCTSLTNVKIPENIKNIEYGTFQNCTSLTNVELPETLQSIDNSAFSGCTSLKSMIMPKCLNSIGQYTFRGCSSLESVEFPTSLVRIGSRAFYNCTKLSDISTISRTNLVRIEEEAFYGCDVENIKLPTTLRLLKNSAFQKDSSDKNWRSRISNFDEILIKLTKGIPADILENYADTEKYKDNQCTISLKGYIKKNEDVRKAELLEIGLDGYDNNDGRIFYVVKNARALDSTDTYVGVDDTGGVAWSAPYLVASVSNSIEVIAYAVEGSNIYRIGSQTFSVAAYSLSKDLQDLSAAMLPEESLTFGQVLGRSGIMHVGWCVKITNAKITEGTGYATVNGDKININKNAAGQTIKIQYSAYTDGCAYYDNSTSNNSVLTINVLNKPEFKIGTKSIKVMNPSDDAEYYLDGEKGTESNGSVTFKNLSPGADYNILMKVKNGGQITYQVSTLSQSSYALLLEGSDTDFSYGTADTKSYTITKNEASDSTIALSDLTDNDIVCEEESDIDVHVNDGKLSISTTKNTPVGDYTFSISKEVDDETIESNPITITVNKADIDFGDVEKQILRAKEGSTLEVTLPTLPEGASYGKVTNANDSLFTVSDVADNKVTLTANEINKGQEDVSFDIAVNGGNNYNDTVLTVPVGFKFKTILEVSGLTSVPDITYDGKSHDGYTGTPSLAKENEEDDGELTDDLAANLIYHYTGTKASGEKYDSDKAPTEAGEYTLTVKVPDDNETFEGSTQVPFTIAKCPIEVTPDENQSKVYLESDPTFTYHITKGKLYGEDKLSSGSLSREEGEDVGTYAYTIGTLDSKCNPNYAVSLATGDSIPKFEITPKKFKGSVKITLSGDSLKYDEENNRYYYYWDDNDKQPEIKVVDTATGTTLERGRDYTISGDQVNNTIGEHKFYVTGQGNYGVSRFDRESVTWEIVKSKINPVVKITGWTYGQEPTEPEITGVRLSGDVKYTYYTDAECTKETNALNGAQEAGGVPVNAGEYWVKAIVEETDLYNEASATANFTIERKTITVRPKANQSKIYGEEDPVIEYTADLVDGDTLKGAFTRESGEDVGEYSIVIDTSNKFTNEQNPNYNIEAVETGDEKFTIERKQITEDMLTVTPYSYEYNRKEHTPTLVRLDNTLSVKGTALTENDIVVTGDTSASDYGVYTIRVTGKNNYKGVALKKWCVSSVVETDVVYDGKPHGIKVNDASADGITVKFKDAEGNYTLDKGAEYTEPGVYTYEYQMQILNDDDTYSYAEGKASLTIEKKKADIIIELNSTYVYGDTIEPSITGNEENGQVTYTYYKKDGENYTQMEGKPEDAGEYKVVVNVAETEHYNSAKVEKEFTISKHEIKKINPEEVFYTKADNGEKCITLDELYRNLKGVEYTIGDITDVSSIIDSSSVKVEDGVLKYTLSGNSSTNSDAAATIPITIKSTNYKDVTIIMTVNVDLTAPTGSIKVADKTWDSLRDDVTFSMFFKTNKEVTIEANDSGIGVDRIYYYIADKAVDKAGLEKLSDEEWTEYKEPFVIERNSVNIVYAKLTDKAGNTSYINSDGIVIYTDSSLLAKDITFIRTSNEDVKANINLYGNTVKAIKNGDNVLTSGDYSVDEDGNVTFKNSYLKTLAAQDEPYTLTISYNPLGKTYVDAAEDSAVTNDAPAETTINLWVKKDEGTVTDIKIQQDKVYDTTQIEDAAFTTTNTCGANNANVSIEYKELNAADSTYTDEKPVDAGDYIVRITVKADDDYLEAVGECEFSIAPKQVTATVKVKSKTYDGKKDAEVESATVDTGIDGQTLTLSNVKAAFKDANAGKKKSVIIDDNSVEIVAGENTKADNYDVIFSRQNKADIEPLKLTGITWGETELAYTGAAQAPEAKAVGVLEGDECTIEVSGMETGTNTVTGKDAYTANAVATSNPNYVLPDGDLTCTYTIVNATPAAPTTITAKSETSLGKADGKIEGLTTDMEYRKVSESGEPENSFTKITDTDISFEAGTYEIRYAAKDNYNASDITTVTIEKGNTLKIKLPTDQTGYEITSDKSEVAWNGEAVLTLTLADNYRKTESFVVKVNGKEITPNEEGKYKLSNIDADAVITVEGIEPKAKIIVTANGYTGIYDGQSHGITVSVQEPAEVNIEYGSKASDGTISYGTENVTYKNAGSYVVYYKVTGENYEDTTGSAKVVIERKKVTVTAADASKHIGKEDDGLTYNATGLVEGDVLHDITLSRESGENAGRYAITATAEASSNPNYDITFAQGTFTIEDHVRPSDCVIENRIDATCTSAGSYDEVYYCAVDGCDAVIDRETKAIQAKGHSWSDWTADGNREKSTCSRCGEVRYRDVENSGQENGSENTQPSQPESGQTPSETPSETPAETPSETPSDSSGNADSNANSSDNKKNDSSSTVTPEKEERNEIALNAGLKVSQTGSQINVVWGRVQEASGYDVYVQYCGMDFTRKSVSNIKRGALNKIVIKKINGKKLDLKKNYKIYVVAYKMVDGKKVTLGKTIMAHIVGRKNATQTNPKDIKLTKNRFTLRVGKTVQIKGKTILVNPKRQPLSDAHAKEFRYASGNKKVATVTKTGKIKAVGKGRCTIYVYARNGYTKKISVTVR